MNAYKDVFGARATLDGVADTVHYYRLAALAERGVEGIDRLPFTIKIILENYCAMPVASWSQKRMCLLSRHWTPGKAAV